MERLILQGGGSTPCRILAPNANVNNPEFSDILFDSNFATLRIWMRGQVALPLINPTFPDPPGGPEWNNPVRTAIPLGKTFSRPPIVLGAAFASAGIPGGHQANLPARFQLPHCRVSKDQTSIFGVGCAASTTTVYPLLMDRSSSGGSRTVAYVVYDRPSGA